MFTCTVVSRPAFSAAGMKVRTDCTKAPHDCPLLWHEKFGPRIPELVSPEGSESYGISWAVDSPSNTATECTFDYFAALAWPAEKALPQGLERTGAPAGEYVECPVPSLQQISQAYQHIFSDWLPKHPEYTMRMDAPSYELFPKDHMQTGLFTLYIPIVKA